jgi:hypothetical protein
MQGFHQNPAMMMAMTLMSATLLSMMSEMAQGNGMMPMGAGGFGNTQDGCGGSPLNGFLGGPGENNNGSCGNGYNNGYNKGYDRGANNGGNTVDGNGSDNNGARGTNGSQRLGKDLPENINNISYSQACDMVKKSGGQLNPDGKPTVLAIRSDNTTSRSYQDAFLVLKPDGTMEKFSANTRPSKAGQDKAMLKNGEYDIKPRWQDGKWRDAFVVGSSKNNARVDVARDRNGDGQYSDSELNGNASSDTIRLHRGNNNGTTSSAGCLNVKDYDGFLDAVGGRKAEFNLVLVTA